MREKERATHVGVRPFEAHSEEYDRWFERHDPLYRAELCAVRELLAPVQSTALLPGLEIGVGSGRFAAPLGIAHGVEPSTRMAALARSRGVNVVQGVAESLPYPGESFEYTLFCTSLCFVAHARLAIQEARRVTVAGGAIVIAYLNPETAPGRALLASREDDKYYAAANLRTTREIVTLLNDAGYTVDGSRQVVIPSNGGVPAVQHGTDKGLFCALRARLR